MGQACENCAVEVAESKWPRGVCAEMSGKSLGVAELAAKLAAKLAARSTCGAESVAMSGLPGRLPELTGIDALGRGARSARSWSPTLRSQCAAILAAQMTALARNSWFTHDSSDSLSLP